LKRNVLRIGKNGKNRGLDPFRRWTERRKNRGEK